jgi:hypothetical protein
MPAGELAVAMAGVRKGADDGWFLPTMASGQFPIPSHSPSRLKHGFN